MQGVCAGMAGLECAARASAAQCQQARQSMQKRSANGHRAKEDGAGELRGVIVDVLADHEQLGWRAPVLQMLCSRRIAQYCCASNRALQWTHVSARDARSGRRQASRAGRHPQTRRGMRRSTAAAAACVAHAWGTPAIAAAT